MWSTRDVFGVTVVSVDAYIVSVVYVIIVVVLGVDSPL